MCMFHCCHKLKDPAYIWLISPFSPYSSSEQLAWLLTHAACITTSQTSGAMCIFLSAKTCTLMHNYIVLYYWLSLHCRCGKTRTSLLWLSSPPAAGARNDHRACWRVQRFAFCILNAAALVSRLLAINGFVCNVLREWLATVPSPLSLHLPKVEQPPCSTRSVLFLWSARSRTRSLRPWYDSER